jgi:hypothetical protein
MDGRGTAVPHFFYFFCCENAAKMHGKRLRRERSKDARKEIAAARTPQECTDNDDFCGNIWMFG